MKKLTGDQDNIAENMFSCVQMFSEDVCDIFERFDFPNEWPRPTG